MNAPQVGNPTEDLMAQLTEVLSLTEYGAAVRITFGLAMALRGDNLVSVVQGRVESSTVNAETGRTKWKPVGLPLTPPEGEGLPELLEILALVARGQSA